MNNQIYLNRQNLLRQRMERDGLSTFLVTHLPNVRYLCGFSGSHALLLVGMEKTVIISDGRYQEQIEREIVGAAFILQGQRRDTAAVAEMLADFPPGKVGFESHHLSVSRHTALSEARPDRDFVAATDYVEDLRIEKDDGEIDLIRQAVGIAEHAFEKVLGTIREGMTERELGHLLEDLMWQAGAETESFETLVLFGARTSLPHGKPGDTALAMGEPILMDFGCVWQGYCSDITRTVFLGDPGEEYREAYLLVQEAQQKGTNAVQPDVPCREADAAARAVFNGRGRGDQFLHSLGHGVGLEIHEAPRLAPTEEKPLRAGTVVTVEPGIYVAGWGGIRIENMVVARAGGPETLNRTSTEMIVL
ncbi:MAG: aminopeptidase P family protein [bacterium]